MLKIFRSISGLLCLHNVHFKCEWFLIICWIGEKCKESKCLLLEINVDYNEKNWRLTTEIMKKKSSLSFGRRRSCNKRLIVYQARLNFCRALHCSVRTAGRLIGSQEGRSICVMSCCASMLELIAALNHTAR